MPSFARRFALIISIAIAVFFLAYPNYVIRPERSQGARELQAALFVMRYQHVVELLCAAVALAALLMYLRTAPVRRSRMGVIGGAALVFLCAALAHVNIYEFLFHPAGAPAFQSGQETRLEAPEKVLAVTRGRQSRAYPVRTIAYHHIVNDVLAGTPIAVTY
jgi:hypothetical protein